MAGHRRYVEFCAANINNPHTRLGACSRFFTWCEQRGLTLTGIPGGSRLCPDWQVVGNHTFRAAGITAYLRNGGARNRLLRTKARAQPNSTTERRKDPRRMRWREFDCESEGC